MGWCPGSAASVRDLSLGRGFGCLQDALGGGDAGGARVAGGGGAQGAGDGLELGLDDVVGVAAVQHVDVQADAGREREGLPDVPGKRGVVAADHRRHPVRLLVNHVRAAREVDGGANQGLVQRDEGVAEPLDARLVAERLLQRLTERDRRVLHRVVRVDLDVALGADSEAKAAVLAQLVEHVVEERDAGFHVDRAGSVEVELDEELGLLGLAGHPADPGTGRARARGVAHRLRSSFRACLKASFSAGVPTETRSQPLGPVLRMRTPRSSRPCQTASRSLKTPKRMKLASLSATVRPWSRSHVTRSSRLRRSASTVASGSSRWAMAARATAWVTVDRWYGSRTSRSASITAGSAAR